MHENEIEIEQTERPIENAARPDTPSDALPVQPEALAPGAEAKATQAITQAGEEPGDGIERVEDENITRVYHRGKEYVLIATAHVSPESAALVKRVIETERPDAVAIELDDARYKNIQNPDAWRNTNIVDVIKNKKVGLMLANLALSAYQKRMAKQLGSQVGGEMLQGIESAKQTGAKLVLADRNVQTTFMRIWRGLGAREKTKLISALFLSSDEDEDIDGDTLAELMEKDTLEGMLAELHGEFPWVGEVLLNERDRFLAAKIAAAPGQRVVAVLGGAHVPGVAKSIRRPKTARLEDLNTVPKARPIGKIIGWAIPIIIVGLMLWGFATNLQTGLAQLSAWVLWNSGLAALGTLLAGGHILTILTAAALAPFTSINPVLACGWFAGLVEAHIRKPKVKDLENLTEDITSLKGFYRNRFLRTLLIVILANLGSSIGTLVAGIQMARLL